MNVGIVKLPFQGDTYCGDQCGYWLKGNKTILCMVDGLGHGEYAEKAAKAAVNYVASHLFESMEELFAGCNRAVRDTRGVAMGIAVIDQAAETLTYAGVGNTRVMIVGNDWSAGIEKNIVRLVSSYGIVGAGYRRLSVETVEFRVGDLVIMFSDGVTELVDLSGYNKGLMAKPDELAARIVDDWGCETDDAAVLVFLNNS